MVASISTSRYMYKHKKTILSPNIRVIMSVETNNNNNNNNNSNNNNNNNKQTSSFYFKF